ncbi:helix-turn-helix domain-containing protein [Gluconacetobacter diazotrophicus]|uniref:helix-turn-helix domain-containing protein n=1 Tax=Gluconacetobacter diazotrophicus TaxID=33996 RepID=UPI0009D6B897|nr:helix-turn-helix domain-containing protein [Gluconacetobacter diazotrophicus]
MSNSERPMRDLSDLAKNRQIEPMVIRLREVVDRTGGAKAVAARTDIPLSTLSGYLSGRELKLSVARKITEACGVSLDWLAAGEDGPAAREFGNARQAGPESVEFLNYDVILSAHQGVDGDSSYIETRISIPRDFLPLSIQSNTDNISAVTAKCDSMNPIIDDGDILLERDDFGLNRNMGTQIAENLIQHAVWIGGQHGWRVLIRWIFATGLWQPWRQTASPATRPRSATV